MDAADAPPDLRLAAIEDLDQLEAIERECFDSDRLSRRSLRRWIRAPHGILLVADRGGVLLGYGLVWCHRGTRLARLYSLAVRSSGRGTGLADKLLARLETLAAGRQRLFMRLEVAQDNAPAIGLYERHGYRVFGEYSDYYADHGSALRMQKQIVSPAAAPTLRVTPWYAQTTEFTCGPAALMMAMASLDPAQAPSRGLELDLWREATTIFMTSGHGGCHPVGLALAARARGFAASVTLNTREPLFLDGVRAAPKKAVMSLVHEQFMARATRLAVPILYEEFSQQAVAGWLEAGCAVLVLISTWRLDGRKAPHWVTVTGVDSACFYVHDPYPFADREPQRAIDCQHLPILRQDFERMSSFGGLRLRTAVVLSPTGKGSSHGADRLAGTG